MITLQVKKRETTGRVSLEKLREEGRMPAVFYGKKEATMPISIPQSEFLKVWKQAGESTVVALKHETGTVEALIHDIDFDPITGDPRHADFYVFEKGHKLEVSVALEFTGVAPGVKDQGGLLVRVLHEIKVEALPTNLPHQIEVDISSLSEIGSQILAQDISLPEGVTLVEDDEEVVALVSAPKAEEEAEPIEVDLSTIEVEKKGKEKNPEEVADEPTA